MFIPARKGHVVNYHSNGRFNVKEGECFIAFATKLRLLLCGRRRRSRGKEEGEEKHGGYLAFFPKGGGGRLRIGSYNNTLIK